ncbi:MAG: 3-hydroxyacyl-ACP dehydratase FabZ [Fimbriimonadaceae bacterium]|nr:3-hydroxyacyl-ACP dehydratase FabZ [Fimbriimonadaceae bacterium]QYK58627.1 MAG: 3-hydroxyacyl-ACP dehydratase FabZ [Fimbriimonadaceae bacterium]
MTIQKIMEVLPHRYPMLLVDRLIELEPGKRVKGVKNVTINEAFFVGHYPGMPVMPGVLIVEAMAQAGAMILLSSDEFSGQIPIIGAIDNVKFRRQVGPGDTLVSEVELLWYKSGIGKIKAVGTVDGQIAAQMELTFKLVSQGTE